MQQGGEGLIERFEASWYTVVQNLGPEIIRRAQLDLTPGQVFMLHFIRKQGECNVSTLAGFLEVNPSAITVMLDRLEARQYVVRRRDERDRRVVFVQLTPAGEAALNEAEHLRRRVIEHCFRQIPGEKIEGFVDTLEGLATISSHLNVQEILEKP